MKSQLSSSKVKLQSNTSLLKKIFFLLPLIKFVVEEESMIPFLYPGNTVLVYRFSKGRIHDTIVFKNPQENSRETYLIKQITNIKGHVVYVEGICKEKSIDSRHFGWIDKKDIIGKMITRIP
jgi:signal peptidase I